MKINIITIKIILFFLVTVSCIPKITPEMEKIYAKIWSCPLEFEVSNERADEYWQKMGAYISKLRESSVHFLTENYMEARFETISFFEKIKITRVKGEQCTKFFLEIGEFATYNLEFEARKLVYWLTELEGDFSKMDWIQKNVRYHLIVRQ